MIGGALRIPQSRVALNKISMPGILGLISRKPREEAEGELRQMIACLRHEDFYVTGTWIDESLGIYIGWVARKGSFADGMPVRNERGDVVLTFAGEEFPEPGTVRRLKDIGHDVETDGPSYLAHLYEEDAAFPAGLNGRFHGFVADLRRGSATLFNDRYGMDRLYYHEAKDGFYFAAEAKAILAVRPELRKLDPRGVGELIACGAVLENRSLFEGIAVLPPASAWTFRNGSLEKKSSYFDPKEWEDQEPLDAESFYRELREAFTRNLPRYFGGRERVAMSLTGGLDTRMIMAWQKAEPGNLPCYTFGSMLRENHDVRVARRVAQACSQPFEVIPAGQEFLSRFPYYAERAVYLTDGCIEVNRSPDLYLSEKAREIAPVRMTGDYGGEVLRGVGRLKPVSPSPGLFHREFFSYFRQASDTHAELVGGHPLSFTVFKQAPWDYRGVVALEQTQLSQRSPFLDNDLIRTVFRAPASAITGSGDCLRLISDGKRELLRIPTDRGLAGNKGRLLSAASRSFLEFQFKAEYAYDMGMPQWVAKTDHVFSALHLERLFLGRHKVFHFRTWYRDALAGYVREMLLDPRSLGRPYVDRKGLEAAVRSHLKGDRNYTTEFHKLLALELIHRVFLDPN
jgi:asparagine synthase (glutamine-hydrolysing)